MGQSFPGLGPKARRLPGPGQVVVTGDDAADAYTLPGIPCRIVITAGVRHEDDGDIHIGLRADPAYRRLLTQANAFQQCVGHTGPHLVVEIIPQHGCLPFLTNSASRGGFVTPAAPGVGDHVTVTGPLVRDSNALHDLIYPGRNVENWAEIHPAWNVTVDQHTG